MKEVQREWASVAEELNDALKTCGESATSLSLAAKVDYYAARRYLSNGVKNRTVAALSLCSFFRIDVTPAQEVQSPDIEKVYNAIDDVWDGTSIHAEFLRKLILSTKSYRVEFKPKQQSKEH